MEPVSSSQVFGFLEERIPLWLEFLREVAQVQRSLARRRASRAPSDSARSRSPARSQPRVSPGGGGGGDAQELEKVVVEVTERPVPPQKEAHDSEHGSVCSDDPSIRHARNRYRARNGVRVQFDGNAQQRLLGIVDGIAEAKELVRRARRGVGIAGVGAPGSAQWRSAWTKSFSKASPGSDVDLRDSGDMMQSRINGEEAHADEQDEEEEDDDDDDDDDLDKNALMARIRMRPGRVNVALAGQQAQIEPSKDWNIGDLDIADDGLERAQDKCHAAAYQLLRDGICSSEAGDAIQELEQVLATTNGTAPRFNAD